MAGHLNNLRVARLRTSLGVCFTGDIRFAKYAGGIKKQDKQEIIKIIIRE